MGKLTWQESKFEMNAVRFCKEKLMKHGVVEIDGRFMRGCKHKVIFKKYFEVFGNCHRSDFRTQEEMKKSHIDVSYIYVIANLEFKVCKIGFSNNVQSRLVQIQTGCPFPLEVYKVFKGTMQQEKRIHQKYKQFRMNGEWFKLEGVLKNNIDAMKGDDFDFISVRKKLRSNQKNNLNQLKRNLHETENKNC